MILLEVYSWLRDLAEVRDNEDREMIVSGPVLVLCRECDAGRKYSKVAIVDGLLEGDAFPSYVLASDGDEFTVVDDDAWPDVAIAALATLALTGKVPKHGECNRT